MTAMPRAALALNFAETPGFLDPRITYTRATAAGVHDRRGVLRTAPAGQPRWRWSPIDGTPEGYLAEGQRTNLLLYSEQLDNAAWTKTSASISANSVAAPDGATTADTITVSGASGSANQAVTITAGNAITVSAFFKKKLSSFARLRISDGTNQVAAWFNLGSGAVGSVTAGASTCIYSVHDMEDVGGGWYRCDLTVTTATSTSFTAYLSCAAADSTEPAAADDIYAWGAQLESPSTTSSPSSYIATTSASATRNGDGMLITAASSWFNANEGAFLLEWVHRRNYVNAVYGGMANTFADAAYLWRSGNSQITLAVLAGSVTQAQINLSHTFTEGAIIKAAFAYKANDFAAVVNGGTPGTDSAGSVPAVARFGVGCAPWSTGSSGTQAFAPFRRLVYWPRRLSNSILQSLTG